MLIFVRHVFTDACFRGLGSIAVHQTDPWNSCAVTSCYSFCYIYYFSCLEVSFLICLFQNILFIKY